jgi:hypothetical protein
MKISSPLAILALAATTVSADRLEIYESCGNNGCSSSGNYYTNDNVRTEVPTVGCDGWRPNGAMAEWCMDLGGRRGHFRYNWEGSKRCLVERERRDAFCPTGQSCWEYIWHEVPCYW